MHKARSGSSEFFDGGSAVNEVDASSFQVDRSTGFLLKQILLAASAIIGFFGIVCFIYADLLGIPLYEGGDFAANSLLIQDAKSFDLLVGHYSRIGFNHPGPAILYFQALGEYVFYDLTHLVGAPFAGQLLSVG